MRIDWQGVHVRLKGAGQFLSHKGLEVDPSWKFWMYEQVFWYVWTGRATMELPQGKIRLKPGMCLWLRPGFEYRHRQDPTRPLGMYSVHFELLTADGRLRPANAPLPPELLSPPSTAYVERVMERLAGANPEGFIWGSAMTPLARKMSTCLLTGLLMELDATAADVPSPDRHAPPHIAHVNEIARRIVEDPSQFKSVADMARQLRYSRSYFTRLYRKVHTFSPQHDWMLSRLRHAARMLLETDFPIKVIAKRLGYCNVHLFTNQFRQYMQMSPGQYRKRSARRHIVPHVPARQR